MTRRWCATIATILLFGTVAWAQPAMDGSANEPLYGVLTGYEFSGEPMPYAIQDGQTGYGDASLGRPDFCNGSELDALYAVTYGNTLYLGLAGNFETNGNRLHLFFDTRSGGQQQLAANNPDKGVLLRMGPGDEGPGLKFKNGFEADFWLAVSQLGDPVTVYCDFAELYDATNAPTPQGWYVGGGEFVCGGAITLAGGDAGAPAIQVALDNTNRLGVTGGFGGDWGAYVYTGYEIAIPLAALGNPAGPIDVVAIIGSGGGSAMSNQILGGLGGILAGNLAGGGQDDYFADVRLVDLTDSLLGFHMPVTIQFGGTPVGACCVGQSCVLSTQAGCTGTYLGDNTNCDGNPCDTIPAGRCCIDDGFAGQCEVTTEAECGGLGGVWTAGETCVGCPCLLPPKGACCFVDNCQDDLTETDCVTAGGEYAGDFVTCASDPCQFGIATPHVAGAFQNWDPAANPMTETAPGSGIWTVTFDGVTEGRYEWKVTDGTWTNTFPGPNSWVYFDATGTVTFSYDTNLYDDGWSPTIFRLGLSADPGTWTATGDFQSEVGGSDWNNGDPVTAMIETPPGSGIYLFEATGIPAGDYAWKAVVTGSPTWDSISWDHRSVNTANWSFTIGADTDTLKLWVNGFAGTARVEVIPAVVGCPGDSNCDGVISWRDIDFFVAAQNDNVAAWTAMFPPPGPTCPFGNNDVNVDGTVSWRDIDPLVAVMNTVCP